MLYTTDGQPVIKGIRQSLSSIIDENTFLLKINIKNINQTKNN